MNHFIEEGEAYILKTYNRFPVSWITGKESAFMILMEKNIWISVQGSRSLPWAMETNHTTMRSKLRSTN